MEAISELLVQFDVATYYLQIWQQKANCGSCGQGGRAVKLDGYTIEEETVVPRAELPALNKREKSWGRINSSSVLGMPAMATAFRIQKEGNLYSLNNPNVPRLKSSVCIGKKLGGPSC